LTEISKNEDELHEEKKVDKNPNLNLTDVEVKPTPLLWLVPIFMGLLGGILMYIAVKDEDQKKANTAILVGFLSTIALIFLYVLIFSALAMMNLRMMDF
jgi:hypothetical protein